MFDQTKGLFGRWLYYGLGTMFSLAVLSVMVTLATDMVIAVAASFWTSALLGAGPDSVSSLALQQGGMGVVLSMLIMSAPPMAAMFFSGTLGNFVPYSQLTTNAPAQNRAVPQGYLAASPHAASIASGDISQSGLTPSHLGFNRSAAGGPPIDVVKQPTRSPAPG